MANKYYNGKLFPEIPADDLANYPYCMIIHAAMPAFNYEMYAAYYFQSPSYAVDDVLYLADDSGKSLYYSYDNETWVKEGEDTIEGFSLDLGNSDGFIMALIWCNHDIPLGSADSTEIYYATSEPVGEDQEYAIKLLNLKKFADQARRIGSITSQLSIDEMLAIFETAVAQSEEEGDTGSGEVQRAEEGYF